MPRVELITPAVFVVTTPYSYVEPILDDGSGPRTDEQHVLFVRARSPYRAKWLALRAWRRAVRAGRITLRSEPDFIAERRMHPMRYITAVPLIYDDPEIS